MLASAGNDQLLKLWRTDGTLLTTFKGYGDWSDNVAFSPDGSLIVSADRDKTVKLWRWQTPLLNSFSGQGTVVLGVALSPISPTPFSNEGAIWSVAFSSDSQLIASGSVDRTVKLWRTSDGANLTTLDHHRDKVNSIVFSRNNPAIVSASSDSEIIVWDLQQILRLDPLVYGCNWVRDYLQTNVEVESDRAICP